MRTKPIFSLIGQAGLLLGVCVLPVQNASARHLQPDEALSMIGSVQWKSPSKSPLELAYTGRSGSESTVYVFSRQGAPGFYVLAADDAVGDVVLGYSHTDCFSPDNMSPGMKWLLDTYSRRVSDCASGQIASAPQKAPQVMRRIEPLMSTKWNQDAPFNDMCPVIGDGPSVTGCVATAVAQIMKKHQWPVTGTGSNAYEYKLQFSDGSISTINVSSDFGAHTYDWSNMLNDYAEVSATQAQKDAVAQLVFDCGVAAGMIYKGGASSASSLDAAKGMLEYFNYDKSMEFLSRELFNDLEWNTMMYSQLTQGMPVLYSGNDENGGGGHAFVLDGYDGEGYFHINWGWGGLADGYYSLDNLSPTDVGIGGGYGRYNSDQEAIVNIRPNSGSPLKINLVESENFTTDRSVYAGKSDPVYFNLEFYSYALLPIDIELGIMTSGNGEVLSLGSCQLNTLGGIRGSYGFYSHAFPNGDYEVYLVYRTPDGEWTPLEQEPGISGRVRFIKDDSTLLVENIAAVIDPLIACKVISYAPDDAFCPGQTYTFNYSMKVSAPCSVNLSMIMQNADSGIIAKSEPVTADFAYSGEFEKTFTLTIPENTAAGEYYLGVMGVGDEGVLIFAPSKIIDVIVKAESVTLNTAAQQLTVGESFNLVAVVAPENTTDKTVAWTTSDAAVATVDSEGKVVAVGAGTATVTATCGDVSATCEITVKEPIIVAEGIALNSEAVELVEGDSFVLEATISPENTTDKTVTWITSDAAVAIVDPEGKVTAIAPGTATITAVCGEVSATCAITVKERIIAAEGIALSRDVVELIEGESFMLEATVSPENTTDKTVSWSTSDAAVATVDSEGKVNAVAPGTAVITATCGDVSATCSVIVSKRIIAAEGITLSAESIGLVEGSTYLLIATVSPDDTTDPTIVWSSSDESIAIVDADGNVTAIASGVAIITATCGDVSASCNVTVSQHAIEIEGITLDSESLELIEGDTHALVARISPENATVQPIVWSSSDESVATVDAIGNVTAIAPGTAIITATCGEVSAACVVTVKPIDGILSISADGISIRVADGYILIQAQEDAQVAVYDVAGTLYYIGYDRVIPVAGNKLYIVVIGSKTFKVKA